LVIHQAKNKKIFIDNRLSDNDVVVADKQMVSVILRNLVTNAVKFTPDSGTIEIYSSNNDDGTVEISVKDSGIGMDEDQLNNLFKEDKAVSSEGTSREKGTGLGLLLVKEFVDKLNGSISVKSQINHGTTFTFKLEKAA